MFKLCNHQCFSGINSPSVCISKFFFPFLPARNDWFPSSNTMGSNQHWGIFHSTQADRALRLTQTWNHLFPKKRGWVFRLNLKHMKQIFDLWSKIFSFPNMYIWIIEYFMGYLFLTNFTYFHEICLLDLFKFDPSIFVFERNDFFRIFFRYVPRV